MINLHESLGLDRDRTRDPWICSQTRICIHTRYRLRYAVSVAEDTGLSIVLSKTPKTGFVEPRPQYKGKICTLLQQSRARPGSALFADKKNDRDNAPHPSDLKWRIKYFVLFDLILYVPVNNLSAIYTGLPGLPVLSKDK